jgi:hypothetical protein
MPILPGRLIDNQKRFESTNWKIEVGQVEETHMHNDPNDPDFVSVTVLIRDKRMVRDGKNYQRIRIPVWQQFIGNRFGSPWMPRQGDMVYVAFFKNEKAFVVASAYNFQAKPPCMPGSDLDKLEKICPWQEATDRTPTGEFMSLPEGKKPTCKKWFNGPVNDDKVPTIGRDWMQIFDFCVEGDEDPTCEGCSSIDWPKRRNNTWRKVYAANTMSCVAPNHRMEDHVYCGSYLRYDSENGPSEEYSEGCGHIRLGNATCEAIKKGHLNFNPHGTIDIHSEHEEAPIASEQAGTRVIVVAPEDSSVEYAVEAIDFESGAYIRIMKDGEIILHSPTKITLDAPLVEETHDNLTSGDNTIVGFCSHGGCSCV